jgi:hypothetical protein
MKKLITLAALAALTLGIVGCTTGSGVDTAAVTSAIVNGYLTYEQLQALKEKADKEQASVEAAEECVTSNCAADATEAQAAQPPVVTLPYTVPATSQPAIVPESGKAVAVFLGNVATCSHCTKLAALNPEPYIETALPDVDWITADKVNDPATYAKYRPKTGFNYPFIRVYDAAGVFKGEFVARNMTLDKIAARIKEVCPSCAD